MTEREMVWAVYLEEVANGSEAAIAMALGFGREFGSWVRPECLTQEASRVDGPYSYRGTAIEPDGRGSFDVRGYLEDGTRVYVSTAIGQNLATEADRAAAAVERSEAA